VAPISFGWQVANWPDTPMSGQELHQANERNLQALEGAFYTVWVSDHVTPPHAHQEPTSPTLECWTSAATPEMIADYFRKYRAVGCDHFMISRFADFPATAGALLRASEVGPLLAE
jgi:hypothetical protein